MKRRTLLGTAAASALTACANGSHTPQAKPTLLLVHGAWHGAWCWERVVLLLGNGGYRSVAVTLPGMGERRSELSAAIDLDCHINAVSDAARAIEGPVVLVGHSYAGFVITGTADRLAASGTLRSLIYVDAFVPSEGEKASDYMPEEARTKLAATLAMGDPAYPPIRAEFFGLEQPEDVAWVQARLTAQPAATYFQPIRLDNRLGVGIRRSYVACQSPRLPVFDSTKARIRADASWIYQELQTGHDAMITSPDRLAKLLIQLA